MTFEQVIYESDPDKGDIPRDILLTVLATRALRESEGHPIVITREEYEAIAGINVKADRGLLIEQTENAVTVQWVANTDGRKRIMEMRMDDMFRSIFGEDLAAVILPPSVSRLDGEEGMPAMTSALDQGSPDSEAPSCNCSTAEWHRCVVCNQWHGL